MVDHYPACPPLGIILRSGFPKTANVQKEIRQLNQNLDRGKRLDFMALGGAGIPVRDRVIAIYDDQFDDAEYGLRGVDLRGFRLLGMPRHDSLGEDFSFMQHNLIENPGFINIVDNDMINPSEGRTIPGLPKLDPAGFSAHMEWALRIAHRHHLFLVGVRRQTGMGSAVAGITRPIPSSAQKDWMQISGTERIPYIQNFFLISSKAKGSWLASNYLEDASFQLSVAAVQPTSVGYYHGCQIRFPQPEKVALRYKADSWEASRKKLISLYGEQAVNTIARKSMGGWKFHG